MTRIGVMLLCAMIMVYGCAAGLPLLLRQSADLSAEECRRNAAALEERGELQPALLTWRAAAGLQPDDPEVSQTIRALQRRIDETAQARFKKGYDLYQAGDFAQARREFLATLRLSPGHPKALHYLKVRLNSVDQQVYRVQRGDSLSKIAADHYKDPGKAYVIAYFNDLDPANPLYIDAVLLLPNLEPAYLPTPRQDDPMLLRVHKALEQHQYQDVLALCDKIRQENPGHPKLQSWSDAGRLGYGRILLGKKQYLDALEQLKQVTAGYAGREQAIAKARRFIRRQALQEKIQSAQARFDVGAYGVAIAICEEVLAQDTSNAKAAALLMASRYQLGKQLLDQGQEAKALETLRVVGPDYQDSAQLLVQAQARLNARAEESYRKGVKYFLNEDLELAIESWKNTLAFNPAHPKARQDMDNAMRLLDKWRGLEQGEQGGGNPDA